MRTMWGTEAAGRKERAEGAAASARRLLVRFLSGSAREDPACSSGVSEAVPGISTAVPERRLPKHSGRATEGCLRKISGGRPPQRSGNSRRKGADASVPGIAFAQSAAAPHIAQCHHATPPGAAWRSFTGGVSPVSADFNVSRGGQHDKWHPCGRHPDRTVDGFHHLQAVTRLLGSALADSRVARCRTSFFFVSPDCLGELHRKPFYSGAA